MQVIVTKYLPATNFKGARIKASCERGSITISCPDELSGDAVHIAAADALVAKFVKEDAKRYGSERNPWSKPRTCGWIETGLCAHVYLDESVCTCGNSATWHGERDGHRQFCCDECWQLLKVNN